MKKRAARIAGVALAAVLALVTGAQPSQAMSLAFERTWGGPASESARGVAVAADGIVYLTGDTNSFGTGVADGDLDVFLIKYGTDGAILWQRTYGLARTEPFRNSSDFGMDVGVAPDGSVYVAGDSDARVLLVRFDPSGNVIGETVWGDGDRSPRGMAIDGDGNIGAAGIAVAPDGNI